MKSRTSLRLACRVAPRLRPSSVRSLECAVTKARLCNSVRINTYKTPRNIHKIPSFKPCICNTYANERRNPFGMNRCTKHGGWGAPVLLFPDRSPRRHTGAASAPGPPITSFEFRISSFVRSAMDHRLSTMDLQAKKAASSVIPPAPPVHLKHRHAHPQT